MHKCHLLIVYFTFSIFTNKYLFTVGFMPFYKKMHSLMPKNFSTKVVQK